VSTRAVRVVVSERIGEVDGVLLHPHDARWLLVLGHGAGAGMRHEFMEAAAGRTDGAVLDELSDRVRERAETLL
jgi:hypothetical protein